MGAEPGHEGRTYDLTGPEALTRAEMAAAVSDAVGRPVTFVDAPPGAMRDALLRRGMPLRQADGLVEDHAQYRRGEAAEVASGVRDATGRPRAPSGISRASTRPRSRDFGDAGRSRAHDAPTEGRRG